MGLLAAPTAVQAADDPTGAERESAASGGSALLDWLDPEPLTEALAPLPYPVDALPILLRDAVLEAQSFVQAPVALVACSALVALSLAGQGLVNVRRDHQLVGPVSLYVLAVADSGERSTTCDTIFGAALREWERDRRTAIGRDRAAGGVRRRSLTSLNAAARG